MNALHVGGTTQTCNFKNVETGAFYFWKSTFTGAIISEGEYLPNRKKNVGVHLLHDQKKNTFRWHKGRYNWRAFVWTENKFPSPWRIRIIRKGSNIISSWRNHGIQPANKERFSTRQCYCGVYRLNQIAGGDLTCGWFLFMIFESKIP